MSGDAAGGDGREPVGVVLVGCGHQGRYHLEHLRRSPAARLCAVVDPDPAARAAAGGDLPTFERLADFLVAPAARAVAAAVVAVPTPSHVEVGCACLEADLAVLLEKPLAATREGGRQLVAAARERLLRVGLIERFNPAVRAAEAHLAAPLFVEVHRLGTYRERLDVVDVVLDLMVHDLDLLLRWTGGAVTEIRAVGAPVLTEQVDIANARLQLDTGCVANLTASRASLEPVRKFRVFARDRYLSVDCGQRRVQLLRREPAGADPARAPIADGSPAVPADEDALAGQLAAFLAEVRGHPAPAGLGDRLASAADAQAALELALDIRDAVDAHRRRVDA